MIIEFNLDRLFLAPWKLKKKVMENYPFQTNRESVNLHLIENPLRSACIQYIGTTEKPGSTFVSFLTRRHCAKARFHNINWHKRLTRFLWEQKLHTQNFARKSTWHNGFKIALQAVLLHITGSYMIGSKSLNKGTHI